MAVPAEPKPPTTVCGVEVELLESFVKLFRNKYPIADFATYLLERVEGINNSNGIANLRDALSHFVTALDESKTKEERAAQLATAEEHLRRATIEPLERAMNHRVNEIRELYDQKYLPFVIPIREQYAELLPTPQRSVVEERLREIGELGRIGRRAKSENLWNAAWEQGATALVEAHQKARELYNDLNEGWLRYEQFRRDQRTRVHSYLGYLVGLGGLIVGIVGLAAAFFD